mmetsp:Transcript_903/g.1349  ORF Transcript_903/g.1349 Transcript_903/m.1349 type:complete len:90 (+) Transcript_903:85-354(+)
MLAAMPNLTLGDPGMEDDFEWKCLALSDWMGDSMGVNMDAIMLEALLPLAPRLHGMSLLDLHITPGLVAACGRTFGAHIKALNSVCGRR